MSRAICTLYLPINSYYFIHYHKYIWKVRNGIEQSNK